MKTASGSNQKVAAIANWLHRNLAASHVGDNKKLRKSIPAWGTYVHPKDREEKKQEPSYSDSDSD